MLNIVIVAQAGRIGYQALLCAASIRAFHTPAEVPVFVATPNNSPRWENSPAITDAGLIEGFRRYECQVTPFDNADFGSVYPHSNKLYAIQSLPPGEPFLFLDSDSVLVGPLRDDQLTLDKPALKRGGASWPVSGKGRSLGEVWRSLYAYFGIDSEPYRDPGKGDDEHQCYPYYNAGIVYYANAGAFVEPWLAMAKRIWTERPAAVKDQPLKPWLDQITLPLVLAKLGIPPSDEQDAIYKNVVHYHFPFYLQVRHKRAVELFDELSKDEALMSVLRNDEGFRYYMSDEAKAIVREVHDEFGKSAKRGGYKNFQETLRHRVPLMR